MMRTYIGFVKDSAQGNMTTVADVAASRRDFEHQLRANGYRVVYMMNIEAVREVAGMSGSQQIYWGAETKSWKQRNDVLDYINQCMDIIEAKAEKAQADFAEYAAACGM